MSKKNVLADHCLMAHSPGKVILSGEHAVVHKRPALVFASSPHSTVNLKPIPETQTIQLAFEQTTRVYPLHAIAALSETMKERHRTYLDGTIPSEEIVPDPLAWFLYGINHLNQHYQLRPCGLEIHITTDLPLGCGMGSSASLMSALLCAYAHHRQLTIESEALARLTTECEHLIHGQSSGIDPACCTLGGFIWYEKGVPKPAKNISLPPYTLINTGPPHATTGTCVSHVHKAFPLDHPIWDDFEKISRNIYQALIKSDYEIFSKSIRENHKLLVKIGVVPKKVQRFINEIENLGGCAKLCGAGSISGDHAGICIVFGLKNINEIRDSYQYTTLTNTKSDHHGTRII